jgi:hypothetical protein
MQITSLATYWCSHKRTGRMLQLSLVLPQSTDDLLLQGGTSIQDLEVFSEEDLDQGMVPILPLSSGKEANSSISILSMAE